MWAADWTEHPVPQYSHTPRPPHSHTPTSGPAIYSQDGRTMTIIMSCCMWQLSSSYFCFHCCWCCWLPLILKYARPAATADASRQQVCFYYGVIGDMTALDLRSISIAWFNNPDLNNYFNVILNSCSALRIYARIVSPIKLITTHKL